ncbi:MAG: iron ABC transporter permease [Candidatus Methanomethylophilaceae archaeon]|nr:iron ABC transporter permease [Candidatus Methanomethylophilaceae archaeon]
MTDEREEFKEAYRSHSLRKVSFIAVCAFLTFIVVCYASTLTVFDAGILDVMGVVWDHLTGVTYEPYTEHWYQDCEVWNLRMPNILFAVIAGMALAVGGAVMQSVMDNPLADPYLSGVSSAACLGVAVALIMGFSVMSGTTSQIGMMGNAFLFSLIPIAMIVVLSSYNRISPATIVLIGVALSSLFNALDTLLLAQANDDTLATVYDWQIGSIANLTWDSLPFALTVTVACSVILGLLSRRLNLMSLGDRSAQSLGLNVMRLRIGSLLVISVMTATVICYAGVIGFLGLVCPHMIRLVLGADNRFVIPASAALGALVLVGAYSASLSISIVGSIPVGVVMSAIGAPILLLLIVRNRKVIW